MKENGKTFEEATDIALEALKIQVKKFKSKHNETKAPKIIANEVDMVETETEEG